MLGYSPPYTPIRLFNARSTWNPSPMFGTEGPDVVVGVAFKFRKSVIDDLSNPWMHGEPSFWDCLARDDNVGASKPYRLRLISICATLLQK